MNTINTERLLAEIRNITLHPEKHNQGLWVEAIGKRPSACGSLGCLAGNAVVNEGHDLLWVKSDDQWDAARQKWFPSWIADNVAGTVDGVTYGGGELIENPSIDVVARKLFGLNSEQSDSLFDGSNTLDDIWNLAIEFTAEQLDPITEADRDEAKEEAAELRAAEAEARSKKLARARKRLDKTFGQFPELKEEIRRALSPVRW